VEKKDNISHSFSMGGEIKRTPDRTIEIDRLELMKKKLKRFEKEHMASQSLEEIYSKAELDFIRIKFKHDRLVRDMYRKHCGLIMMHKFNSRTRLTHTSYLPIS